ncbi:hypothetical protein [Rhodopirellula bahusiensis]|uniref:Uncharacterized protein n=1 Tax=Rhodopirellula bahusiensis TaxID=2014065 RepID=A0A2G1W7Y6_9BACT|nr:hypothetical protein [Rhodopirellula bahusiensis]PHQ35155.1 hypothetical protein CEE69_12135 [Rhodopirellula bahusiensis]
MSATSASPASDSSATKSAGATRKRKRLASGYQILLIVISSLIMAGLLFVMIRTFGYVEGTEFAPKHFQTRRFSFYEIPLVHWQITPIHRVSTTPETARYLTQSKILIMPNSIPGRWDLVEIRHGIQEIEPRDPALLVDHLRLMVDGKPTWKQWSKKNPKLAKQFWPTIDKLADRELYILIPRLMELTRDVEDVATLKTTVADYLAEEYVSLIRDMRDAERHELADDLLAEALEESPDNPELQSLKKDRPTVDPAGQT